MNPAAVMFYLVMGLLALHLLGDLIERVAKWRKQRAVRRIFEDCDYASVTIGLPRP